MQPQAVIDARAAARREIGGVERWTREVAARLPALRPDVYTVARPPEALAHRAGQAWEQFVLPVVAARRHAVLVCPANLAPLAWPRNVIVLHDVSTLRHPEWYGRAYGAWQRALLPALARRAARVVTVSAFSRHEIAAATGLDEAAVTVVPGGVDERFAPDAAAGGAAREMLGLERPYVLTVATQGARKNLAALTPAAAALAERGVELVAAGGRRDYLPGAGPAQGVRALGYVSEDLLPGLYAGAAAFVLASRYEGFGLPCLEAMASGVPVVAAAAGALPETCGDAALLADPDDPAAFASALLSCLEDEAAAARLRVAGLERVRAFGWDRTARELDAVVREVARPR